MAWNTNWNRNVFSYSTVVSPDDWLSVPDRGATLPTHEYSFVQVVKLNYMRIQRTRWIIAPIMMDIRIVYEFPITCSYFLMWKKYSKPFWTKANTIFSIFDLIIKTCVVREALPDKQQCLILSQKLWNIQPFWRFEDLLKN